MRINYKGPQSQDGLWHNDAPPAINETNLNQIEREIKEVINEVNEYVVANETELNALSSGSGKLMTDAQAAILNNIDAEPTLESTNLVTSGGVAKFVNTTSSNLTTEITNVGKRVTSIETALPSSEGKILPLAAVATSGDYNDLKNKLTAGANITISANNVISSTGGGGGDIPTGLADVAYTGDFYDLVNYPNPEEYEIVANKTIKITQNSTDEEYPSAKAVYSLVGDIESALSKL